MSNNSIDIDVMEELNKEAAAMAPEEKPEFFNMSIKKIPQALKDKFDRLKAEGKIHCNFSEFIRMGIAEQLKRFDN